VVKQILIKSGDQVKPARPFLLLKSADCAQTAPAPTPKAEPAPKPEPASPPKPKLPLSGGEGRGEGESHASRPWLRLTLVARPGCAIGAPSGRELGVTSQRAGSGLTTHFAGRCKAHVRQSTYPLPPGASARQQPSYPCRFQQVGQVERELFPTCAGDSRPPRPGWATIPM